MVSNSLSMTKLSHSKIFVFIFLFRVVVSKQLDYPFRYDTKDPEVSGTQNCSVDVTKEKHEIPCSDGNGVCSRVKEFEQMVCVCYEKYASNDCSHERIQKTFGLIFGLSLLFKLCSIPLMYSNYPDSDERGSEEDIKEKIREKIKCQLNTQYIFFLASFLDLSSIYSIYGFNNLFIAVVVFDIIVMSLFLFFASTQEDQEFERILSKRKNEILKVSVEKPYYTLQEIGLAKASAKTSTKTVDDVFAEPIVADVENQIVETKLIKKCSSFLNSKQMIYVIFLAQISQSFVLFIFGIQVLQGKILDRKGYEMY